MKLLALFLFLSVFFFLPQTTHAALYINEFSSGTLSDWVELYNSDSAEIDLSQFYLRDSTESESNKIDLTGTLPGNGYFAINWSSKLNNGGDQVRLFKTGDNSIVDEVSYGEGGVVSVLIGEQTAGRNPDGSSSWAVLSSSTKGSSNNTSTPVPTATPTPTDIPTPTNLPTPTKTPSPTKTPTPKPTSIPSPTQVFLTATKTPTKSPTPTPESDKEKNEISSTVSQNEKSETTVLGEKDEEAKINPETKNGKKGIFQNFFGISFFAGGLILLICGILFYFKTKEKNENFE